ncbi:MAG TPA: hypothetical protein VFY70_00435 [Thermomicrobiales bacterium]|nr:hypothetical protein [Thermomicrobiales bacterium]
MNRMNRTTIVALLVVAVALLLGSGVVLAKNITCTGGPCVGTKKADIMIGSAGTDQIKGRGGADGINGFNGDDTIDGGGGNDSIGDQLGTVPDVDHITGGKGNDIIDVREGDVNDTPDQVDCGPGTDTVFVDATDTRLNCEILNPK